MKTKEQIDDLWPGQSEELLKALHILTRDGKLNQDSRRKLKQVQHLVQLITPALESLPDAPTTFADLGAGKSYLGFLLYDLWLRSRPATKLWAVESRPELISACQSIAAKSGFDRSEFVSSTIEAAAESPRLPQQIDVVTALHACDTATDAAIGFALRRQAKVIALVPCCQAEAARLLEKVSGSGDDSLWRHGLHRREFGSHLTNVFRSLVLESLGYKVRVTELVGWEHSLKNEMILAVKIQRGNAQAKRKLQDLRRAYPLDLGLFSLVESIGVAD